MPITTMTSPETLAREGITLDDPRVAIIHDYHGHAEGQYTHSYKCPRDNASIRNTEHVVGGPLYGCIRPECTEHCGRMAPLYMITEHVGLVLDADGERNGYDDSDFYATVWNPEKGAPEQIVFATTRGWTYPNHAEADATPEVVAAFKAWRAECARKAKEHADAKERRTVRIGKRVKVVKGRKVPQGTEGVVFWHGAGDYGPRVGVRDDAGTVHWTAESNVEVMLGEDGEPIVDESEQRRHIERANAPRRGGSTQRYSGGAARLRR